MRFFPRHNPDKTGAFIRGSLSFLPFIYRAFLCHLPPAMGDYSTPGKLHALAREQLGYFTVSKI
jgi:hypothetical protein